MTALAIGFAPAAGAGGAAERSAGRRSLPGMCRARAGAIDVLHLPADALAGPRDRLRAAIEAHRALDAFLPLTLRRRITLEAALALARSDRDSLLSKLHDLRGACEIELLWQRHAPGERSAAPADAARGAEWLRSRVQVHRVLGRQAAALRAMGEAAGGTALTCQAGPGWTRAVMLSCSARVETLLCAIAAGPRDALLAGGRLLVTGPWPVFTAAGTPGEAAG